MNWIILILAGLMEVGFTFCLGKTKTAEGRELLLWWTGFIAALSLSMFLMAKALRLLADKYSPGIDPGQEIGRFIKSVCIIRIDIDRADGKEVIELTRRRS